MRRVLIGAFILLFLQVSFAPSATAQARTVEIAYDDGTAENSVALEAFEFKSGIERSGSEIWIGHSMLAVEFTPPTVPSRLLDARIYVAGEPETFKIRVFRADRAIYVEGQDFGTYWLYLPFQWSVTPTSTGWVQVDLSSAEVYIWESVYVAVEFLVDSKPNLGLDTSNPSDHSWYLKTDKIWLEYSRYAQEHGLPDGNLMIRATTVPLSGSTTTSATATSASTTTSVSEGRPVFLSALQLQVVSAIGLAVLLVAIVIGVRGWKRR